MARLEIEEASTERERLPGSSVVTTRARERVAWGAAVVLLALSSAGVSILHFREQAVGSSPEYSTG